MVKCQKNIYAGEMKRAFQSKSQDDKVLNFIVGELILHHKTSKQLKS